MLRKVIQRTPVGDYRGDEYTTKTGKKRHKKVKTVKFTTTKGKSVQFEAHVRRKGGTLRRGWTVTAEEAQNGKKVPVNDFIRDVDVVKTGDTYTIVISNNVEYCRYVEYGHRTRNHKGWVNGVFMLTISEEELKRQMDAIIAKRLNEYLRRCFND